MPAPDPQDRAAEAVDEPVIDLTDSALAAQALRERLVSTSPTGELVIDLRDSVLETLAEVAPTGRTVTPSPVASGRPADLQDGLRIHAIDGGPRWDAVESFVYDMYTHLGYTHENRAHQVAELATYRDRSRFYAAVDPEGTIVGTCRTIVGHFHELPIGQFQRIDFYDEDPMCELSSIVVDPRVRSTGILEHLCRAGWTDALHEGARTLCALGERWMIGYFRNVYCMPFVPVAVPDWYMGAEIIPMTMAMNRTAFTEVARENPEFWHWNAEALDDEVIDELDLADLAGLPTAPA